uniref:Uncharacterized protein n=1 Tax=Culex quinquefasciatus TaxID=7176 RepID=A0A1S4JTL0_CULQU
MFTVVVLIVALVLLVALDTVKKRRLYPAIPTVSPCYPLVGNVLKFQGQTLEQKFRTLTTIFSTAPRLFKLWLGPVMVVGVTHPELIQKLLNDPNCLEKPFFYDFLNMKHGLISARIDFWKVSRKVLNPTMNVKFLHDSIPVFEKCSRNMVNRMKACPKLEEPIDVLPFTMQCSLEMVCATTMGAEVLEREGSQKFMEDTEEHFMLVASRIFNVWLYSDVIYRKTKQYLIECRTREACLDFAMKTIKVRRAALKLKDHKQDSTTGPKILIDQVLTMDINKEMSDQNLCEQIWTLVAAGSDTAAHGVAHACLILAMFPHLQEKLLTEIKSILPSDQTPITPEALKHLTFLDMFFKECLRVAPLGPIISRKNLAPIKLDGNRFPPGTMFLVNFCGLHQREDIWGPAADQFDPERFQPERARLRHPYSYLPFSTGSRNCIGWRYAMINTKVMLIHIVRNFRLSTTIKYEELRFAMGITLHLAFKHLITLEDRTSF